MPTKREKEVIKITQKLMREYAEDHHLPIDSEEVKEAMLDAVAKMQFYIKQGKEVEIAYSKEFHCFVFRVPVKDGEEATNPEGTTVIYDDRYDK